MTLRQRLENLPVGQKLLAALLVLLVTILLMANLTFISAAYWITQESMAPQAMQTIGRLVANPQLAARAGDTPETARALLKELESYTPLRAAAVYGGDGRMLAQLQHGEPLALPKRFRNIDGWRLMEFRSTQLIRIPRDANPPAHLLLVASSELPTAFYTGTLSASLGILVFSVLLWIVIARQIKRLITQPINQLEELSRQVTREESYALRAQRGNDDEIGSLAEAFNTMLSRIEAREQQLKSARDEFQSAYDQAQQMALALATRNGQGLFAFHCEVCGQCYQFIGRMQPLHCKPLRPGVAQVAGPVGEVLHAAEGAGDDSVERLCRLEGLDPAVDNREVVQLEFHFHLSQETGLLAIGVQHGDALVWMQDSQRDAGHATAAANIQPVITIVVDKRHDAKAVEQVTRNHLVRVAHSSQVVGFVPFDQQSQVAKQLLVLLGSQLDTKLARTCGQLFSVLRGDQGTQALCSNSRPAPRFFK